MSDPGSAKRGLPLRVKMRHGAHFVDELAARHEAPVGKLVPLSAIRPNQGQPRSDFGDLGDLIASIRDKELRRRLTPDYDFGCKRPTFSNGYYRAFTKPHVHLQAMDHADAGHAHPVPITFGGHLPRKGQVVDAR